MNKSIYNYADNVSYQTTGDNIMVVNPETNKVYILGEIESMIWSLIPNHTFDSILYCIQESYEGDDIAYDLSNFLDALLEKQLIHLYLPEN